MIFVGIGAAVVGSLLLIASLVGAQVVPRLVENASSTRRMRNFDAVVIGPSPISPQEFEALVGFIFKRYLEVFEKARPVQLGMIFDRLIFHFVWAPRWIPKWYPVYNKIAVNGDSTIPNHVYMRIDPNDKLIGLKACAHEIFHQVLRVTDNDADANHGGSGGPWSAGHDLLDAEVTKWIKEQGW